MERNIRIIILPINKITAVINVYIRYVNIPDIIKTNGNDPATITKHNKKVQNSIFTPFDFLVPQIKKASF